ncbi:hypothetical protein FACS1894139_05320 [Planctomycetales bacterium]|nr:hypothetical protein FACS1894139_05320 [Planctomycetales bacterium]
MVKFFAKKKYEDGQREFYLFGVKVFSYFSTKRSLKNLHSKVNKLFGDNAAVAVAALTDPLGFGMLDAKMASLHVPDKYKNLFYEIKDGDICIDGGANRGKFTDAVLHQGAECYAFEPNGALFTILRKKYGGNEKVHLYNAAVGGRDGEMEFYRASGNATDEGASLYANFGGGGGVWWKKSKLSI